IAARRIVFGKYLNCGQTCVAPDYLYVHRSVKDELLGYIKAEIAAQHGDTPLTHPDWGKIINEKHWARLMDLIDRQRSKVMVGGAGKADTLQIAPTVLDNITWEDPIMQDEIFGPILPVLVYDDLEEVVEAVGSHDRPLALYIFTKSKRESRYVLSRCRFGGGCVNDTIIHLATTHMGFGGVGESGMGSYHGKAGFDTFSHHKSIVDKATWLDLPMRYRPYSEWKDRIIRAFLR
ncbi:MAG: aldehyde dehydrogenase family protein, partial [Clostridia bacterium]|nr:aldehyde dehydrogenase family protein [Clostridia bacterium]